MNMNRFMKAAVVASSVLALGACTTNMDGNYDIATGPAPTRNVTPYETALVCYANQINEEFSTTGKTNEVITIAVGNIKDYTGKFSYEAQEGGYKVTQGGTLMVMSALGHLGKSVKQVERFDTSVADIELGLAKNQMLGVNGGQALKAIHAGQITASDYYIVGGITEANFNIQTGGFEVNVNNIGAGSRVYVMNVAVDLRIVDSTTLEVVDTVSLQKQIVGREIITGSFRFFNNSLVDVNSGTKSQEPMQLGVRATLQAATLELVSTVFDRPATDCANAAQGSFVKQTMPPTMHPGENDGIDYNNAVENVFEVEED